MSLLLCFLVVSVVPTSYIGYNCYDVLFRSHRLQFTQFLSYIRTGTLFSLTFSPRFGCHGGKVQGDPRRSLGLRFEGGVLLG